MDLQTADEVQFLGQSAVAPVSIGFLVSSAILYQIGLRLNNTTEILWVVAGWSIASSVSFSLAGSLSDIFGRRNIMLAANVFCLVGSVCLDPLSLG